MTGIIRRSARDTLLRLGLLLVLMAERPAWPAEELDPPDPSLGASEKKSEEGTDPVAFFKKHLFPYEPIYFIVGTKSPNAKFQLSLKYELFDPEASLGKKFPPISNLYLGYTQTSLWDWNHPSAPFEDTSYKPEFFYTHRLVDPGKEGRLRLDVQGGYQHESNGQGGESSRSLNLLYLKPTLVLGREKSWQFTLAPRAWVYVLDLSDNPDIADYRGYADLVATVGRAKDWQLSAYIRMGASGRHASYQFDLSYRLNQVPKLGMTWYAHAQYFTGYGEDFLHYRRSSDMFRLGFSLYR